MFRSRTLFGALLLGVAAVQAAQADVAADRVWADWQAQASAFGFELEGQVQRDGKVLRVADANLKSHGIRILEAQEIALAEEAGEVTVTFPKNIMTKVDGDPANSTHLDIATGDLALTATEAGPGLAYAYTATKIDMEYSIRQTQEGYEGTDTVTTSTGTVSMSGLSGQVMPAADLSGRRDFAFAAKTLGYNTNDKVEGDEYSASSGTSESLTEDVVFQGQVTLPPAHPLTEMDSTDDFAAAVQSGLSVNISGSQGKSVGKSTVETFLFGFSFDMVSDNSTFDLGFDKTSFRGNSDMGKLSITFSSPLLPFPQGRVDAAGGTFQVAVPLATIEEPQDFVYDIMFKDMALSDEIWASFDPTATFDRGPINLVVDLTGKVIWQPFALLAAETTGVAVPPPQVTEVNLNNLHVAAAGAEVTGKGQVTLDWSAVTDMDGSPTPLGTLDFTLKGVNGLIDKAVSAGLIPEAEAAMPRMMLSMFAKPGDGDDVMTSAVEFRPDGGVYANGQRMQ